MKMFLTLASVVLAAGMVQANCPGDMEIVNGKCYLFGNQYVSFLPSKQGPLGPQKLSSLISLKIQNTELYHEIIRFPF